MSAGRLLANARTAQLEIERLGGFRERAGRRAYPPGSTRHIANSVLAVNYVQSALGAALDSPPPRPEAIADRLTATSIGVS